MKNETEVEIRPPYLVAEIWGCGDEVCDCYQPQITKILPHVPPRPPWIRREKVWEGTFHSQPEPEEWEQMKRELREAAAANGITLKEGALVGTRPLAARETIPPEKEST